MVVKAAAVGDNGGDSKAWVVIIRSGCCLLLLCNGNGNINDGNSDNGSVCWTIQRVAQWQS